MARFFVWGTHFRSRFNFHYSACSANSELKKKINIQLVDWIHSTGSQHSCGCRKRCCALDPSACSSANHSPQITPSEDPAPSHKLETPHQLNRPGSEISDASPATSRLFLNFQSKQGRWDNLATLPIALLFLAV